MKTNFLKTSLSAFAFALAIVASFAFSPVLNNAEETDYTQGFYQILDSGQNPSSCVAISEIDCTDIPGDPCTYTIGSDTWELYINKNIAQPTVCLNPLYIKVP